MLNVYKQNYPDVLSKNYVQSPLALNIAVSRLFFHGVNNTAVDSDGHNNMWGWINKDLTIITISGVSHFVQQDASDLVTSNLLSRLDAHRD